MPGIWYVEDSTNKLDFYLPLLSRMTSPIRPIYTPIWAVKLPQILEELTQSNVQPLVLVDIQPKDTEMVAKIAKLAISQPRRLIMAGKREVVLPPTVERVQSGIEQFDLRDLMTLPWESYGAIVVRRYMRNEPIK